MDRPNPKLLDLTFSALEHGITSVVGTDGPLVPFALLETRTGARTIARFTTGSTPDEARQHARAHVAKAGDCHRYAIAADGSVAEEGRRVPVVMVESGDRNDPHGYSFIQRFSSTPTSKFAEPMGKPSVVDRPDILRVVSE